jgi:hypothetical protein
VNGATNESCRNKLEKARSGPADQDETVHIGNGKVGQRDLGVSTELLPLSRTWWVLIRDARHEARRANRDTDRARKFARVEFNGFGRATANINDKLWQRVVVSMVKAKNGEEPLLLMSQHDRRAELW